MNGAQSSNGTTEAETNLKITLKIQNLLENSYQNRLAWGIYNGIINYFY